MASLGSQSSQVLCVHALRERGSLPPGSWEHNIRLYLGNQLSPVFCLQVLGSIIIIRLYLGYQKSLVSCLQVLGA